MLDQPEKSRHRSAIVLRVNEEGRVVGMNESALLAFGAESLQMSCDRVVRGTSESGEQICRPGCATALAAREESDRSETGVRIRKKTVLLLCQRVGNEVVVVADPTQAPQASERLTPREREVLAYVARGLSSSGIARELGITKATVRTHVEHALGRLGAKTRAEAVLRAIHTGQLSTPAQQER